MACLSTESILFLCFTYDWQFLVWGNVIFFKEKKKKEKNLLSEIKKYTLDLFKWMFNFVNYLINK